MIHSFNWLNFKIVSQFHFLMYEKENPAYPPFCIDMARKKKSLFYIENLQLNLPNSPDYERKWINGVISYKMSYFFWCKQNQ